MCSLHLVTVCIRVICTFGLILSHYSFMVEIKTEEDENYVAMCDISENISCTKAFSSEYGRGFGIIGKIFGQDAFLNMPNSCFGIIFYCICLCLSCSNSPTVNKMLFFCCFSSNFVSVYLAYILYFVLFDVCIICITTYLVNAALTYLTFQKLNLLKEAGAAGETGTSPFTEPGTPTIPHSKIS